MNLKKIKIFFFYMLCIFQGKSLCRILQNVELITGDVRDLAVVDKVSRNCDYIYNFSGIVDSDAANSLSVDAIDTEIMGLQNICRSSKKNNVKQIIFGVVLTIKASVRLVLTECLTILICTVGLI